MLKNPILSAILLIFAIPVATAQPKLHLFTFKISPYYYTDKENNQQGAAVEFFNKLMDKVNLPHQTLKTMPGKRLKSILGEGKNIMLFPLVYKPERESFLDFFYHTHSSSLNFVGYEKDTLPNYLINFDIAAIPPNLKIGVNRGTIFEIIMNDKNIPKQNLHQINSTEQNFSLLFFKRIDYVFTSPGVTAGFFRDNPEFQQYYDKTKVLIPPVKQTYAYTVTSKDFDPTLKAKLYQGIDELYQEGFFKESLEKYGYIIDGPRHHLQDQ